MLFGPRHRHRHRAHLRFLGNLRKPRGRGERLFVDEALAHRGLPPFHRQVFGEPRSIGPRPVRVLARQHPAGNRRVRDQADTFLAANLRQLVLKPPVVEAEIVLDRLITRRSQLFRRRDAFHQPPAGFIRATSDPHLARAHQFVEHFHRFLVSQLVIGPVSLIKVDVIGPELGQARLDRSHDVAPIERGHPVAQWAAEPDVAGPGNLGRHNDRVARLGFQPFADDFLGPPDPLGVRRDGIAFGGIVKVDSGIKAAIEDPQRGGFVSLAAEGHRAHADIGHDNGGLAEAAA